MTGHGTKPLSFTAVQEAGMETERPFAVRTKASLMKLIADVVRDAEDAAGGTTWANIASKRRATTV
jgi:hypothetical protein